MEYIKPVHKPCWIALERIPFTAPVNAAKTYWHDESPHKSRHLIRCQHVCCGLFCGGSSFVSDSLRDHDTSWDTGLQSSPPEGRQLCELREARAQRSCNLHAAHIQLHQRTRQVVEGGNATGRDRPLLHIESNVPCFQGQDALVRTTSLVIQMCSEGEQQDS